MTLRRVLLATDRPHTEYAWQRLDAFEHLELHVCPPAQACAEVNNADAIILDVSCPFFNDNDELLVTAGKARALGRMVALLVEHTSQLQSDADLFNELCQGLVFPLHHSPDDIASALLRRLDPLRVTRFEYLTVDPNSSDLLAILGTSETLLLSRPVTKSDDGSPIQDIELSHDATYALISLENNLQIQLRVQDLPTQPSNHTHTITGAHPISSKEQEHLGIRFKQLRLTKGLTQAEVAKRSGIHRPNIARVEAGRHTPSLDTLRRLAEAIGVSPSDILTPSS